jgi:WD40 repeat protein
MNNNNYNYNNNSNRNYNNNFNQYQVNTNSNQRKGKLEYLTSTLTATIIEYTEKHIDNSPVIFYRIKVTDHFNNNSWVIEKRYNEFSNLQKKLSTNFPDVPKIPGKTFFRVSDFASIKKRKDGLQYFLKTCINRKDIFASESFKSFLELEKNSPDLCGNSPDMQGNFTLSQGVRDFKYIQEENIIVLCTAEMNIIERAESKITDIKNKIEKQEEITNPQGFVYVYRIEENNGEFNFRETWRRKFKARTRCIYYDIESRFLIIGRTDGIISIHSLDKESKYKRVDLVIELKNHLSSVTGIWFDPLDKKVFSVSADKRFVASDTNYNSQITEISRSAFDYTCLKPDIKYERLFTASEGGVIEIFSFKKFPPTKICSTSITGVGNIRDFYININQFYIFACDVKGKITVLDFGSINNKNNNGTSDCSEISQFGGKTALRAIIYDEIKKELITGDENGKIVVWSIKTGQPIFSWAAHDNGSAVTRLFYDKDKRILVSGSKDKSIKFWKLPDNWINSDVLRFENEELKKINNEIARRRIKAQQEIEDGIENDFDSDLSQEDDLNGWNYRKDK